MITVFALMIYAGQQLQQPVTYWYDINRCKYFASRVMNQPAVPGENKTKYIAVCKFTNVDPSRTKIYD
tara:strand:- start:347 stop:550 length:204 start_codon:yes stop_codon:yes gene_type:complete